MPRSSREVRLWAAETLASAVGVSLDPVKMQRVISSVAPEEPEGTFQALRAATLAPTAIPNPASSLETVELPLLNDGLVVLRRYGNRVQIATYENGTEWLSLAEARELIAELESGWISVTVAASMDVMAHHHSPWARLRELIRLERDDLWVVLIYAIGVGLFTLAAPVAVQALVTTVAFGTLLQPILVVSLLLMAALIFQSTLTALQGWVVEALQQRLFARTAMDLAWRLPRVKASAADHGFGPEAVNRFFEVVTIQKTVGSLLTDGIATVLQISIGLLVLAFYHPWLFAFAVVLVLLISAVIWIPARRGLKSSIEESYAKYEVAAWLESLARPGAVFRTASGAALAVERADALTRKYLRARAGHFSILYNQTIGTLALQVLASVGLLGLGGFLVVGRELTLGQLVASELIVGGVAAAVGKLGKQLDSLYDLLTSADKLGHLLDEPLETPTRNEAIPGEGPLWLQLEGPSVNLDVASGERLALTGKHEQPLAEWLAAMRVPDGSAVRLNGIESELLTAPELREAIAIVRGDDIFDGSVLENVTVGRSEVSAGAARAALERVGLLQDVRGMVDGIDTQLLNAGSQLTPQQRLQLTVARAVAGKPRLIVVDAALEQLEPEARAQCIEALTAADGEWTLIALVNDADSAMAAACGRRVEVSS